MKIPISGLMGRGVSVWGKFLKMEEEFLGERERESYLT
jgi:hypothetical protein